jgi:hypothetical protein
VKPIIGPNDSSNYHSGLGGSPSDTLPHVLGRYLGPDGYGYHHFLPHDGSSIRDGSTVGNIYAHYLGCEDTDGLSDGDQSLQPASRNNVNRQASSHGFLSSPPVHRPKNHAPINTPNKAPPNFSLPKGTANQHLAVQYLAPSTSQAISNSSSYGDTGVLLDVGRELQIIPAVPSGVKGNSSFPDHKVGSSRSPVFLPIAEQCETIGTIKGCKTSHLVHLVVSRSPICTKWRQQLDLPLATNANLPFT